MVQHVLYQLDFVYTFPLAPFTYHGRRNWIDDIDAPRPFRIELPKRVIEQLQSKDEFWRVSKLVRYFHPA